MSVLHKGAIQTLKATICAGELTSAVIHMWVSSKAFTNLSCQWVSVGHTHSCFKAHYCDCLEMSPEALCAHKRGGSQNIKTLRPFKRENTLTQRGGGRRLI